MEQKNKRKEEKHLLPFHIIKAASEGDAEAIQAVLKHYESYIAKLSTRKMYDEFGQAHYCVDETLRRRLETKLIAKTLAFNPVPYKGVRA
ncbi:helix-turn-helix domain-containing protein [Anaerotruncus sp. 1XD22-93]|nr:helix-turn-helix domain-containing protein [Lachnospiraceae bacterium]NBI77043.1 helix-turn-helix domain-containing protein [Lachnospiraceae bacterium]RKJ74840.1 helix-turn-helix domain-containing protein [Anaerotruncus sp. 1XD22-93]